MSAEVALLELVPKVLAGLDFEYDIFSFQGKPALLRHLPNRLKIYKHRPGDDWRVFVLADRDSDDCKELKKELERIAASVGLETRTASPDRFTVVNRIVIEELEAWYFGDVDAIVAAYPRVSRHLASQRRFRDPDAVPGGTWEQLERLLVDYHPGGLEKIRAAQEISVHMDPRRNRSRSFQVFRDALLDVFK